MSATRLSVVIATFNRAEALARLLRQLAVQTLAADGFEVVVVDDGSQTPVKPFLDSLGLPYALRVEEQVNQGAAAARHRGILAASGELLVLLDDDMQVGTDFLQRHLERHQAGRRLVVLGSIEPDPQVSMPLFERWHAHKISQRSARLAAGEAARGLALYTGNVSLWRRDYLAVGGFDASFAHSEDVELGLRLQAAGVEFEYCDQAVSLHGSDHASLRQWRERSAMYGAFDHAIAAKHPDLPEASPWRFLFNLNPLSRPLMALTVLAPELTRPIALLAYLGAAGLGVMGLERAALTGANVAFGLDYFRGLRREVGAVPTALAEIAAYSATLLLASGRGALLGRALAEIRQDQAALQRYERKYGHSSASQGRLATDLVQKIGLQELAAYRLMRALRAAGMPLATKVVSRAIRHLYGSDIHWDAELAPGVMLVHGMGLAISHAARVGTGCILFQNVTLGMGTDPVTRESGAPTVEQNVHIGPGATLIGPIRVGAGSKVMGGAVLARSVPSGSVVLAPEPQVRERRPVGAVEARLQATRA
jgi:serine acetyltransferase/GT2 family glycosyltransferase